MPKTYTAAEVEEIVRECLGKRYRKENMLDNALEASYRSGRNDFRTLALERLEKRLSALINEK